MYFDANGRKIAGDHHANGQTQAKGDWEALVESLDRGGVAASELRGRYRVPFVKADREAVTCAFDVFAARLFGNPAPESGAVEILGEIFRHSFRIGCVANARSIV